ncbi:FKBP-type peptidyl-prolyl cis-trans isomerase [Nocardioides massiliensis]|uniref:peptidylprolyl isomerase n=1 Tax=Nocardioides massiliensis TaxID=1325935 RepID=A0ABT9NSK6_9ACTN|nr:FKBP-type peptidyl-prolyl cis-trans isomerase [Nocardioides massiliensis]MDP9823020.1 peptidylprolyl isomerase [Nocardioides massiliensis]
MSRLRRFTALTAAAALVLVTAACGSDDENGVESAALSDVEVTGEVGQKPDVTVPEDFALEETVGTEHTEGDGVPLVAGKPALIHITMVNVRTGDVAISTYDQEQPLYLQAFDEANLFKTIVETMEGAASGSRYVFGMQPGDLYGEQGNTQFGIEPDDDVIAVVDAISGPPEEVLDGPDGEAVDPPADTPTVVEDGDGQVTGIDFSGLPKAAPEEFQVITLIEGEGPEARDDSVVSFNYLGQVWGREQVFDESYSRGEPTPFGLGVSGLIRAWDEGLVGTKRGSRVMIIAPPEMAYGDQERPGSGIPPNSTLVFVIDVLGVS